MHSFVIVYRCVPDEGDLLDVLVGQPRAQVVIKPGSGAKQEFLLSARKASSTILIVCLLNRLAQLLLGPLEICVDLLIYHYCYPFPFRRRPFNVTRT